MFGSATETQALSDEVPTANKSKESFGTWRDSLYLVIQSIGGLVIEWMTQYSAALQEPARERKPLSNAIRESSVGGSVYRKVREEFEWEYLQYIIPMLTPFLPSLSSWAAVHRQRLEV